MLGVCDYLSFGSESDDINLLCDAAAMITTEDANNTIKEWLDKGVSYAVAQQKAADFHLSGNSNVFNTPNNVLGIEYIKAINKFGSQLNPITVKRTGGDHDSDDGYSGSGLRKSFIRNIIPTKLMTEAAAAISNEEIEVGRGPIMRSAVELAILSRLRGINSYHDVPGISEGLESRFMKYASTEPSVDEVLRKIKTKRYTMARLRRILMCATLGIKTQHVKTHPSYIRVLAMNSNGKALLGKARKKTKLPILTKPAAVYNLSNSAVQTFELEAASTDFYSLAYPNKEERTGGKEWRQSPIII